jgi:UDP-2-acetamido-3-amino-2,3-dideoxy-glucuronate N-acetyltransferase
MTLAFIHESAQIDESVEIGLRTKIWHFCQIRSEVSIGSDCVIGRGVYVGPGVKIGNLCKIQNNALIYETATLEDGVFIGPGVILTNDRNPRAVNRDLSLKSQVDWHQAQITVRHGASVGAGAVCVAPLTIGRWSLIGAGSVVTKDVKDYALVTGSPARQVGWVGKSGHKLVGDGRSYRCPVTGDRYLLENEFLKELPTQ